MLRPGLYEIDHDGDYPRDIWEQNYVPPQVADLQWRDDWDDEQIIRNGEQLLTAGVPAVPSNMDMHCVSVAKRHRAEDAAYVQTFIDNFETFLEELSKWQPPH